ncbi:MAG: DNA-3-methyladenine glycosylase I [Chlorobi bacterium]|nr:DNA-3-methyladenine glycosylase I [Chlorobiota bacterium]
MNKIRCEWAGNNQLYIDYHDTEWGVPVYDDAKLFEFLTLEGFQAGLSWLTILKKRKNFRKAFDNFDYKKISTYTDDKVAELMNDAGIVRNKLKIQATINNANAFIQVQQEFGTFSKFVWSFTNGKPVQNMFNSLAELPAKTKLSDKLSNELKKRGFKFVGSTIVYAHMQATGMVNDHIVTCFRHKEVSKL